MSDYALHIGPLAAYHLTRSQFIDVLDLELRSVRNAALKDYDDFWRRAREAAAAFDARHQCECDCGCCE